MQYSIIKLSEVRESSNDFRIDAEFYHPKFLNAESIISNCEFKYLKDIATKITDFGAYSQNSMINYLNSGEMKFIRNQDILGFFIDSDNGVYISRKVYDKLSLHLELHDILIQRAGTLGKASIVLEENLPSTANQNLAQVKINHININPLYVLSYLNCYYGLLNFDRLQTGNVQPWLNLSQIQQLKIPILKETFQHQIATLVNKSYELKEQAKELYQQAEELLLEELGLIDFKPKHQLSYIKTFTATQQAKRFDAEYFQPKYKELVCKIEEYANGCDVFSNLINVDECKYIPEDNKDYRYIELSNISSDGEITGYTKAKGKDLPTRARRSVIKGDVIVSSIEGSLDSIALINDKDDNIMCSNGFHVVRSNHINSETLLIFFKSIAGQMQLKKGCSGTILTAISKKELDKTIIPKINKDIQSVIQDKVTTIYKLKTKAKHLLEVAKKAVEIAIEENEEKAEEYIREQTIDIDL